ncbi:MAG: hypothetical protein Q8Q38_00580 [bacterium]|nr:hypothetical protein [bacterium]MDZ4231947.1 hypothetical protein [Candidatus Pacearchaeota archaeon]
MRFRLPLQGESVSVFLRRMGYHVEGNDRGTGELKFARSLVARAYPKFHLYCTPDGLCNLHLDQKEPSYRGSPVHSGEYEGELVESEAARIQGGP